jgi:protocatechuate 3,4-dioxygenase beta subunit
MEAPASGLPPSLFPRPHGPFVGDDDQTQVPPPTGARDPRTQPPQQGQPRDAIAAANATGTSAVTGRVVLDDGQPVRRARVTVRNAETRVERAAATDEAGRFAIRGLPAGRYTLTASKPAFLTAYMGSKRPGRGPGSSLALAAGQTHADVTLTLSKGAVIAGAVKDDFGQPVAGAIVQALQYRTTNGVRTLVPASGLMLNGTDDRGAYRIFGLQPGAYVVSVTPPPQIRNNAELRQLSAQELQTAIADLQRPAPPAPAPPVNGAGAGGPSSSGPSAPPMGRTVGYAQVYYPGTYDQSAAAAVTVAAGQELTGIDFPMRMISTSKVSGTVLGPDGSPMAGAQISLQQANPSQTQVFMFGGSVRTTPDGKFTATNIAPGHYTVTARAGAGQGAGAGDIMFVRRAVAGDAVPPPPPPMPMANGAQSLWALAEIDVTGEDVEGITMTLAEGMTVSGRVAFTGKTLAPPDPSRVNLMLLPATPGSGAVSVQTAQPDATGNFKITGVMPGKYRLQVNIPGTAPNQTTPGWAVRSAIVAGQDTLDTSLEVRPGENVDNVAVTVIDQTAELSGSLIDANGKPAPGFTLLVFSTDRAFWTPNHRRLAQPTQPASDGKFRITNLPPGEYYMAAVTDLEPGDWGDTTFMEAVAAAAFKITIGEGEKKVQDLKIAG